MRIKAFTEVDNTVTISCPRCNKTKTVNAAIFKGHTKIRVKCPCGGILKIELEKRKQYRKQTELKGTYHVIYSGNRPPDTGIMTVVNISRKGVGLKFKTPPMLNIGDHLKIKFNLDDRNQTLVEREVVIQNIETLHAGASFHRSSELDNVIGFYLFK